MMKLLVLIVAVLAALFWGVQYYFYMQVLGDVREAVRAHRRFDGPRVDQLLAGIPRVRGDNGVGPLIEIVESKKLDLIERQLAQMALWKYRAAVETRKLRTFGKLVEATAIDLRVDTVDATAEELLAFLRRKDPAYRMAACRGLAAMGKKAPPSAVELLLEVLEKDDYKPVRGEAAEALGHLGVPKAVPPLAAIAKDDDGELGRSCVEALGRIPGDAARGALEKLLEVRPVLAAEAFEARRERSEALAKQLASRTPEVRLSAARALAVSGDRRGLEVLVKGVGPGPNDVRLEALRRSLGLDDAELLRRQVGCASDPDPKVRAASAAALGASSKELAAGALRSLLTDDVVAVKAAAMEAIALRRDPSFMELLEETVRGDNPDSMTIPAIQGLASLSDHAIVPTLREILSTPERTDARKKAAWLALKDIEGRAPELGRAERTLFEAVQPVEIPQEEAQ